MKLRDEFEKQLWTETWLRGVALGDTQYALQAADQAVGCWRERQVDPTGPDGHPYTAGAIGKDAPCATCGEPPGEHDTSWTA